MQRELPGVAEIGRALVEQARARPWAAIGLGLGTGYVLGGGLFTRSTRLLLRAALGSLASPALREQVRGAWRGTRAAEPAGSAAPF